MPSRQRHYPPAGCARRDRGCEVGPSGGDRSCARWRCLWCSLRSLCWWSPMPCALVQHDLVAVLRAGAAHACTRSSRRCHRECSSRPRMSRGVRRFGRSDHGAELSPGISPRRLSPASANRKRPRSILRVSESVRVEIGPRLRAVVLVAAGLPCAHDFVEHRGVGPELAEPERRRDSSAWTTEQVRL